jgi:hypothetical protein
MRDSLKKFEAVVAVVFFRSWRTLRFLGEIRGRSGCFSSLSYPPRSFLLKQERKKERKIPRLPPPFFLACLYGRSHMDASSSFIPKSIPLKIFVDIVKHLELIISSVFRGHVI